MTTRETIEAAFRGDLPVEEAADAVAEAIALLDTGEARLAEPGPDGAWTVNALAAARPSCCTSASRGWPSSSTARSRTTTRSRSRA